MNYISHIPLIGGFTIAAMNVFKTPPLAITSYCAFYGNDKLLLDYLEKKDISYTYETLDQGTPDLSHLYKKLDLVVAVPPCSGLSTSSSFKPGARKNAPANEWMFKSAETILGDMKPTIYCFENAPGLFTDIGEHVRVKLMETAKKHGYAGTFYKTNSLFHGIPQFRPRTYTIFYKGDKAPIINQIRHEAPTTAEYLKSIPKRASLQKSYMCGADPDISDYEIVKYLKSKFGDEWRNEILRDKNHEASYDFLKKRKLLYEYRDFLNKMDPVNPYAIKDIEHVIKKTEMNKNFRLSYKVLILDKDYVYAVVREMMERNVHPTEDRRMSIREFMHLMGLPHDFDMPDDIKQYAKLTQNVPVKTSEDILKEVEQIINGNRSLSTERFIMIDNTKEIVKSNAKKLF